MGRLLGKPYVVLINGHRPASDAIITMDEGRLRFSTARHTARLFVDASRYPMIHKIHFVLTLSDGISCPFNFLTYISKMSHLFICKKTTTSGFQMWDCHPLWTSGSRVINWSLWRWKDVTLFKMSMILLTSISARPILFWSLQISNLRTITWLHLLVLLALFSLALPLSTIAIPRRRFLDQFEEPQQRLLVSEPGKIRQGWCLL